MATIVLDTSILVRLVLPSQRDDRALALWMQCNEPGSSVVIPSQGISEAMAVIRRTVFDGRLSTSEGDVIFSDLEALVQQMQVTTAELGAWETAKRHHRPDTYDCEFYALAERLGAEFWTADDHFVNALASQRPTWVHRLSEVQ